MTDLSQARDGHILLRMSDRHAWAEIYVTSTGWIPFDIQPAQVESHAETPVDMELLEELMAMIGPDEELIPTRDQEEEPGLAKPEPRFSVSLNTVYLISLLSLLLLVLLELYLRFSYLLPSNTRTCALRAYRALLYRLRSIGFERQFSETHEQFLRRVAHTLKVKPFKSSNILTRIRFDLTPRVDSAEIVSTLRDDLNKLSGKTDGRNRIQLWIHRPSALMRSVFLARSLC